ncbi:CrcB family protein [Nocardiopsis sp. CNT-189]|uniref:fluoride efflux transporter FluC n=1 Tax=Nocardiopsis oceanisediminis TaxID=2816862 RepID=UPI003B355F27
MTALMVALGAAIGAPLRYLVDRYVQSRHDSGFPWGTHAANATACLLFGAAVEAALPERVFAFAATGLLGALSTYSTFGYETFALLRTGARFLAFANAAASIAAGLGAAAIGAAVGRALTG